MSKALESLFAACEELEASDVHVMAGRKPSFRVRGALAPNGDFRELDAAETETLALELGRLTMPPRVDGGDAAVKAELLRRGSLDEAAPAGVDVTAVTDYRRLYFLFKVSSGMVAHEKIGVVLYPPDSDNTGKSYSFSCDLKRCAKTSRDGYNAELEVDVSSVRKLVRGEIWRVRFFRNPDGNEPDVRFPLEIGEPKLANGSFEQFKEPGKLAGWSLLGADNEVVDEPGRQHALKMAGCYYGLSGLRSFGTKPHTRKVKISFRAWGRGTIFASFVRYKDERDPKNPRKYVRSMPSPGIDCGKFSVADESPRYFESHAEIPAGEWVALSMRCGTTWDKEAKKSVYDDGVIDDVSITDMH